DRDLNFLIGVLLTRSFNSLWRARQDAVAGYYAETLTLARSAFEHWLTVLWLEQNRDATDRWLWAILEEVERPPVMSPSVSLMMKDLRDAGVLTGMYDLLSKFVHPRGVGLRWMLYFDRDFTQFHVGGAYDE